METTLVEHANPNGAKTPQPGEKRAGFSLNNMRLRTRLTLLVLFVGVPLILISNLVIIRLAETRLIQVTNEQLNQVNSAVLTKTEIWVQYNEDLLRQLSSLDQFTRMEPAEQKQVLEKTGQAYPHLFLIHTLNPDGYNVARSDGQENRDYSDRDYYIQSMLGEGVTTQIVLGRTFNQPTLVIGMPIRGADGKPVGVVASAGYLTEISDSLVPAKADLFSHGLVTYIVDTQNKMIAHPDPEVSNSLADYTSHPAVRALRGGTRGGVEYTDSKGAVWYAYLAEMENGWGVITEQPASQAFSSLDQLRLMAWTTALLGALLTMILAYFVIRRALAPISDLTAKAAAIAAGDFNQTVQVQRGDELGELAESFNVMTGQVRDLVDSLEQRVAERTRAIELSSEVSRRLATILNPEDLAREVVDQMQRAFNYYQVHIYLFDNRNEDLVMAGGTGEAGRVMLSQGHKIPRGKGLVGRAASTNRPVIVENTEQDSNWLPNPLLPETKAEAAVPISVGDRVLGVLDVQQNRVSGLDQSDIALIQSIANQVAVALQNARAYAQVQQQAERESLISALSQKIQRATTIEEALQVAVSELGQALSAKSARIELRSTESPTFKN